MKSLLGAVTFEGAWEILTCSSIVTGVVQTFIDIQLTTFSCPTGLAFTFEGAGEILTCSSVLTGVPQAFIDIQYCCLHGLQHQEG